MPETAAPAPDDDRPRQQVLNDTRKPVTLEFPPGALLTIPANASFSWSPTDEPRTLVERAAAAALIALIGCVGASLGVISIALAYRVVVWSVVG